MLKILSRAHLNDITVGAVVDRGLNAGVGLRAIASTLRTSARAMLAQKQDNASNAF